MKKPWLWLTIAGLISVSLLCLQVFFSFYKPVPDINGSQKVILYSRQSDMEGADYASGEMFYGEKVLGKVEVTDPHDKAQVVDALYKAINEGKGEVDWSCFIGRHALRFIRDDQTVDVLISFRCNECIFITKGSPTECRSLPRDKLIWIKY